MKELPVSGVAYYDFDFPGYIAEVAERQRAINEQDYDEAGESKRISKLGELVIEANAELKTQLYLGHDVLADPGAVLTADMDVPADQESVATSRAATLGLYAGLYLLRESLSTGSLDYSRSQICHRVLLHSKSVSTPFVEEEIKRYGYVPVDNTNIDVLRPGVSYLPNESWLKSVASGLYEKGTSIDLLKAVASAYESIKGDMNSQVPLAKKLDWLYDQINETSELVGKEIVVDADEFLFQSGKSKYYSRHASTFYGTMLGFMSMPVYTTGISEGRVKLYENIDFSQVAMCIETELSGQVCLLKVPLLPWIKYCDSQAKQAYDWA